jgi:uncharacterized protein (TIGR02391 family)
MTDKELLAFVNKLEEILINVSTGSTMIKEVEEEYKEIYYKVAAELDRREVKNPNNYSSLWDFYNYWSDNLPSYQSRRKHVRDMYKDIQDNLQLSIEKRKRDKEALANQNKPYSLELSDLHEDLILKCEESFKAEMYDNCVFNALKLLENKVRERADMSESDIGVDLMNKVFSPDQTMFAISEDEGEVNGWRSLFAGAMGALKNPHSHKFEEVTKREAFFILCFVSLLLDFVDELQEKPDNREIEYPTDEEIDPEDIPL